MTSTSTDENLQQYKDETESSIEGSFQPSSLSIIHSSPISLCSCECSGCTDCDYKCWKNKRIEFILSKRKISSWPILPRCLPFSSEENAESKIDKVSKKIVEKFKDELLNIDYCPYSSDNCGCSSGCTDCDYGLYTYTIKKKSKVKKLRSSSGFGPLKTSEKKRRSAKSFSTTNILRKKRARAYKIEKPALESCYPESSDSNDCTTLGYMKRDLELYTTKKRILNPTKKTSARNSKKLETKAARTLKLFSSKKVSKNVTVKISKKHIAKNWFTDSSNSDCNVGYSDCGKHITIQRKKLKNKFKKTRASTNLKTSDLCSTIDGSVKTKKGFETNGGNIS